MWVNKDYNWYYNNKNSHFSPNDVSFTIGMEVAAYMGSVAKSVSVLVRGKAPFENILGIKIGSMIKKVKHYMYI
jgi:hypothetical protein